MADQAEPVGRKPPSAYAGMQTNLSALAQGALRLADLQVQLLGLDVQEFWKKAKLGTAVLLAGAIAMLASLPVLLFGVSEYLRRTFDLSLEAMLVLTGVSLLAVGGLATWWGLRRFTKAGAALSRSQQEFQENLAWFRSVVHQDHDEERH